MNETKSLSFRCACGANRGGVIDLQARKPVLRCFGCVNGQPKYRRGTYPDTPEVRPAAEALTRL